LVNRQYASGIASRCFENLYFTITGTTTNSTVMG